MLLRLRVRACPLLHICRQIHKALQLRVSPAVPAGTIFPAADIRTIAVVKSASSASSVARRDAQAAIPRPQIGGSGFKTCLAPPNGRSSTVRWRKSFVNNPTGRSHEPRPIRFLLPRAAQNTVADMPVNELRGKMVLRSSACTDGQLKANDCRTPTCPLFCYCNERPLQPRLWLTLRLVLFLSAFRTLARRHSSPPYKPLAKEELYRALGEAASHILRTQTSWSSGWPHSMKSVGRSLNQIFMLVRKCVNSAIDLSSGVGSYVGRRHKKRRRNQRPRTYGSHGRGPGRQTRSNLTMERKDRATG